mmetsp:Transcript_149655/g.279044  ORF Transcript_149655/g.279044 Transcript_149655/m.279044 type:complete len:264 (+) Transcript_149655:485-1276(+)
MLFSQPRMLLAQLRERTPRLFVLLHLPLEVVGQPSDLCLQLLQLYILRGQPRASLVEFCSCRLQVELESQKFGVFLAELRGSFVKLYLHALHSRCRPRRSSFCALLALGSRSCGSLRRCLSSFCSREERVALGCDAPGILNRTFSGSIRITDLPLQRIPFFTPSLTGLIQALLALPELSALLLQFNLNYLDSFAVLHLQRWWLAVDIFHLLHRASRVVEELLEQALIGPRGFQLLLQPCQLAGKCCILLGEPQVHSASLPSSC